MSKRLEGFFKKMLELLPSTRNKYKESINKYGEILGTVVIEDIFMPEIIKLLNENKNNELLERMFEYFEEISNCEDKHLLNIFSTTVLEVLGNDKVILNIAEQYMGPITTQLQIEADIGLGRI